MKTNIFANNTSLLFRETVFKFCCRFSFPQCLGGVQDSDHSIYEMLKKKDEKTNKQTKKYVMVLYFILPWLFTTLQVEIQFALGKGLRLYMNI